MSNSKKLDVQGISITIYKHDDKDFISLSDIAKHRDNERSDYILQNWMRNRSTIEFMGLWEQFNNPNFNSIEFDGIKNASGIGIVSKTGRYGGGTYAHKNIAFEFATWLSAEFKFFLIKEFQRLKEEENNRLKLDWNLQRTLAKVNYYIHTDAIKENLIPKEITKQQIGLVYATEADLLNVALFGFTAKDWREANTDKKGNVRDHANWSNWLFLAILKVSMRY